jgi:MFS family permease
MSTTIKGKEGGGFTSFFLGLPSDWRVTATRTSMYRLFYQMVLPYLSIYTIALGANGSQLGMVNSIGMISAAVLSLFTGSLMDKVGPKRIYLAGISLLCLSWLIYGVAGSWPVIIPAMIMYYVGYKTSIHSCAGICANCLCKENRATAMSICETLATGLLGIIGPLLGAFIVGRSGGVSVQGIRPLFFICLVGNLATFLLILFKLSDRRWGTAQRAADAGLIANIREVFRHGKYLKRFIVVSVITQLPEGMIIPFTQPFAAAKGAREFILGAMVTGFAITPLLLGIPVGRLADRIGKKKMLLAIAPLFWLSCIILIVAKGSVAFLIAGVLQGAFYISGVLTSALQFELVEPGYMGRWVGVLFFFQMIAQAIVAFIAGLIWDHMGPQFVFLIPIALDILIRIPLLLRIREGGEQAVA